MFKFATLVSTVVVASLLGGCATEVDGEGDINVEESGDQLLAGRRISEAETAAILRTAGFEENVIPEMVCTAKYESSFYEGATNRNNNGSTDTGLFQINSIHLGGMRGCPSTKAPLLTASTNARCALAIYNAQGLNAWYGYRAHKTECNNYRLGSAPAARPTASGGGADGADCFSSTLRSRVDEGTCVESRRDSLWYQCDNGTWRRGSSSRGTVGACSTSHPLD